MLEISFRAWVFFGLILTKGALTPESLYPEHPASLEVSTGLESNFEGMKVQILYQNRKST